MAQATEGLGFNGQQKTSFWEGVQPRHFLTVLGVTAVLTGGSYFMGQKGGENVQVSRQIISNGKLINVTGPTIGEVNNQIIKIEELGKKIAETEIQKKKTRKIELGKKRKIENLENKKLAGEMIKNSQLIELATKAVIFGKHMEEMRETYPGSFDNSIKISSQEDGMIHNNIFIIEFKLRSFLRKVFEDYRQFRGKTGETRVLHRELFQLLSNTKKSY